MTEKEFAKACSMAGYSSKMEAESWAKEHPKTVYTENDMIEVYREKERRNYHAEHEFENIVHGVHGHTTAFQNASEDD